MNDIVLLRSQVRTELAVRSAIEGAMERLRNEGARSPADGPDVRRWAGRKRHSDVGPADCAAFWRCCGKPHKDGEGFTTRYAAGIAVSGEIVFRKPKPDEVQGATGSDEDIPL